MTLVTTLVTLFAAALGVCALGLACGSLEALPPASAKSPRRHASPGGTAKP